LVNVFGYFEKAKDLLGAGRLSEAIGMCDKCIELNQSHQGAYKVVSKCLRKRV
jgi:hypothetical protein